MLLGHAGDGMVKVTLRGTGQITRVDIDESLMVPGDAEMVGDLVAAAHAGRLSAELDARSAELMAKASPARSPGCPACRSSELAASSGTR